METLLNGKGVKQELKLAILKILKDSRKTVKTVENIIDTLYSSDEIETHRYVLKHPGDGRIDIRELDSTQGFLERSVLFMDIFEVVCRDYFIKEYGDRRIEKKNHDLVTFLKHTFNAHSLKLKKIGKIRSQEQKSGQSQNPDKEKKKKKTKRNRIAKVSKKGKK